MLGKDKKDRPFVFRFLSFPRSLCTSHSLPSLSSPTARRDNPPLWDVLPPFCRVFVDLIEAPIPQPLVRGYRNRGKLPQDNSRLHTFVSTQPNTAKMNKTRQYNWFICLVAASCMTLYGFDSSVFNVIPLAHRLMLRGKPLALSNQVPSHVCVR